MVKIIAAQFSGGIRYRGNSALHKESKIKSRRRKIAQSLLSREALQLCRSEERTPFSPRRSFLELFVRIFRAFLPICFRSAPERRGRAAEHRWRERGARDETFNKWQSRYEVQDFDISCVCNVQLNLVADVEGVLSALSLSRLSPLPSRSLALFRLLSITIRACFALQNG